MVTISRRPVRWAVALLLLLSLAAACSSDDAEPVDPTTTTVPSGSGIVTVGATGDHTSIQEAVDAADAGDVVLIDPGVYSEAVVVEVDELVIRGRDRNSVVVDGGFESSTGFDVRSDGVVVENLTIRNYVGDGIRFARGDDSALTGYRVSFVTSHNNGGSGITAVGATRGQIDDSYVGGNAHAGVAISSCSPCDALVRRVRAEHNGLGVTTANASDVLVAENESVGNRVGIAVASQSGGATPSTNDVLVGNLVVDNNDPLAPESSETYRPIFGTGIAVVGAADAVVERNTVVGNQRAGILVIPAADVLFGGGADFPVVGTVVRGNVAEGAATAGDLVLAMLDSSVGPDGNCFEGNEFASSFPPDIEQVAPCGGDGQVGFATILAQLDLIRPGPSPPSFQDVAPPALDFENRPGAADAPARPATDVPESVDPEAVEAPDRP